MDKNTSDNTPKRHHFLPQFYLEGFKNDNGYFWVYDREENKYTQQTPINTCVRKYYYSLVHEGEVFDPGIESFFSTIEGWGKSVIDKINNREGLSIEDKVALSYLVSFQITRVPGFEDSMKELHRTLSKETLKMTIFSEAQAASLINNYKSDTGKQLPITPKELLEYIQGEYDGVPMSKKHSLQAVINLGQGFAQYFMQMNWGLIMANKETSFITTDDPFTLLPPPNYNPSGFYGYGLVTPRATKVFPLSQATCLLMGDPGNNLFYKQADRKSVKAYNLTLANNCHRYLIGRDKILLERLVKTTGIDRLKKGPRFKVV